MQFVRSICVPGLLSFPPDMERLDLQSLNVLIGPNGSGKTNLIEAFELLRATPTDIAAAVRGGGGADEWLWKGENPTGAATVDIETGDAVPTTGQPLRYRLEFTSSNTRVEVLDEAIEDVRPNDGSEEPYFYYRFQRGRPIINAVETAEDGSRRHMEKHFKPNDLLPNQSVLAQLKGPGLYPEISWIAGKFGQIQVFRDWTFGRYARLRQPQLADLPEDRLLPDSRNLSLILNQVEHRDPRRFYELLKRFFPRFERMTTKISSGTVQFYLHESDFVSPISAMRLSDGTVRFVAILATLLAPLPPPLVCIEEPELGLHPDAVALVADLLIEASERMQIIVTTHSDTLVSALTNRPEAVVVFERPGAGTEPQRLDPERLAHWLNRNYTLGDVWLRGGIGGNP